MPVDEANLETLRLDLEAKIQANRQERSKLSQILNNIDNIQMVDDQSDPPVKVSPEDRGAGGDMTSARRNSVYDNIVSDHAGL